jgi:phosphoribosylformylglycinamidine cyclo-ligase
VRLDLARVPVPPVFGWLAHVGRIAEREMLRTFNCGIGMVAVAAKNDAEALTGMLTAAGEVASVIGRVERGSGAKVSAKGKSGAEAVRYSGALRFAE